MIGTEHFRVGPLGRRWLFARRPSDPELIAGADGRKAPRYELTRPVSVLHVNVGTASGVTINISRSGTAVRIDKGSGAVGGSADLSTLQEVSLQGLVEDPVDCLVVAYGEQILRLRFMAKPHADAQIAHLIEHLAAVAEPEWVPDTPAPSRHRGSWLIAAGVVAVLAAGLGYGVLTTPGAPVRERLAESVAADSNGTTHIRNPTRPTDRVAAVLDGATLRPAEPADGPVTAVFRVPAGTHFAATIRSRTVASNGGRVEAAMDADLLDPGDPGRVLLPLGTQLVGWTSGAKEANAVTPVIWTSVVLPGGKPLHFLQMDSTPNAAPPDAASAPLISLDTRTADQVSVQVNRDLALPAYHVQH